MELLKPYQKVLLGLCLLIVAVLVVHEEFFGWRQKSFSEATGIDSVAPELMHPWPIDNIKMSWLGHASMLIECSGLRILVDPHLGSHCSIAPRTWPAPLQAEACGPVDLVLISHAHRDHLDPETLSRLQSIGTLILPRGCEDWLKNNIQVHQLIKADSDQQYSGLGWKVESFALAHGGHRNHPFRLGNLKALGYVLHIGSKKIVIIGDSGADLDGLALKDRFRPDIALLPIGAYSPAWPIGEQHLNPEQAVQLGFDLGVSWVIPIHFGTFRLSLDDTNEALPRFAASAKLSQLNWSLAPVWKANQ